MTIRLTLAAACVCSALLPAHGGRSRGPTTGGVPGAPGPGAPPGRVAGAPLTGGTATLDVTSWRVWWELNHERFVRPARPARVEGDVRRALVTPALQRALARTQDPDISSASLVALGKAGVDLPDTAVLDVLRQSLSRGNVEVREAAVLALGLTADARAFADLDALVRDSARGRKLIARDHVGDRERAFAGYALGLLASHSDDAGLQARVLDSLLSVLDGNRTKDPDVLAAALNGIRLLAADPERSAAHKRVLWTASAALEQYLERRFSDTRAAVQAHALTALAALVGRGDGVDQQRTKALVAARLARPRQEDAVYSSAVVALGALLLPGDTEQLELLARRVARPPDSMVERLGLIAFGEIGGAVAFEQLSRAFQGSDRGVQAWAALGLGLLAHHATQAPTTAQQQPRGKAPDLRKEASDLLLTGLRRSRNHEVQAATALALGLAGHGDAVPQLRKLLDQRSGIEDVAGPVCVSLALLDDSASMPSIRAGMQSPDRAVLYGQAALALAHLGQRDASAAALGALRDNHYGPAQLRALAATAQALGHLKNPDDVGPLCLLVDGEASPRTRRGARGKLDTRLRSAFAAAALGSVADRDPVGFGARIARGMDYTANLQTISNGRSGILDIF